MATTPLTLMESTTAAAAAVATSPASPSSPTAAQTEAAAIGAAAATTRPTHLFAAGSIDSASATANSAAAATSPGGGSSSSAATSPSFLPEMPQWKKDLIQRRKSNVARTIGAGALTPTTPTTPNTAAASAAATATSIAQQQPLRSTLSDHQQLQQPEQQHEHEQHAADGLHSLSKDFALPSTTVLSAKSSRHSPSQQQLQQQQSPRGEQKSATALTVEQQNAKSNLAKMPATTPHRSPTKHKAEKVLGGHYTPPAGKAYELARTERDRKDWSQQQQQQQQQQPSPSKQSAVPIPKQRSLFLTPAQTNLTKELPRQQQREVACTSPVAVTTATSSAAAADTNSNGNSGHGEFHASEKRIGGNAATTTTRLASSSTARETVAIGSGAADGGVVVEATVALEVQETETTRKANVVGKSGTYAAAQRGQIQSTATTSSVPTTPTGASTPLSPLSALPLAQQQQPQPHQSHSKYESERSLSGTSAHTHVERLQVSNASTLSEQPAGADGDSCSNLAPSGSFVCLVSGASSGKIFSKLQNNQFIKQELIGPTCSQSLVAARYQKYKTQSLQESNACGNLSASVAGSGSVSSSVAGAGAGSPTKTTSSTAPTACAIKKKMVAVQEMKKTTQNTNHNHHNHHHHNVHHHGLHQQQHIIDAPTCARENRPRPPSQSLSQAEADRVEFDPSEDLSYGPGIVSKLRCRYLSLAYRESMEKERHCLENMRRATSLNNLLDRDDRKDELDDVDADEEVDIEVEEENGHVELQTGGEKDRKLKPAIGILKHSHDAGNQQDSVAYAGKKTATFQKHGSAVTTNGTRASQSDQSVSAGGAVSLKAAADKSTDSPRSRHVKRGNDSLKRARSVEALLCERSPWNYALSRSSYDPCKTQALSPTCVTIEDKINNARGRIILGTDAMPPKRLSSVIDDTERPPPDLVKQTLKKFEATANRRGRGPHRANGKGEVASKVANYKTIIMENKPPIVFPKPPLSPTKKLISPHLKPVKPVVGAADLLGSPLGRKTTGAASAASAINSSGSTTAKVPTSNVATVAGVVIGDVSEHSPDIIQRYNKLLAEKSESGPAVVDSPVSALTKKLGKLRIDADKQSASSSGGGVVDSSAISGVVANVMTKESQTKQQLSKLAAESASRGNEVAGSDKLTGGAVGAGGGGELDGSGGDAVNVSVDNDKNNKHNDRASAGAAKSSGSGVGAGGGDGVGVSVELDSVQAGTGAISSDLSDDESGPLGATKRVTKTALDNIARAGTTQQFKFAGQSTKTSHISNGSGAQQQQKQQHRTPLPQQHTNPDIPTSVLNASPGKQIGVIRPLLTTASTPTTTPHFNSGSISNNQQQQQQHMETLKQHSAYTHHTPQSAHSVFHANSAATATNSPHTPPPLTSREIEKNRINEMKKTASTDTKTTAAGTATANNGNCTATAAATAATTSLNTVINTNAPGFKASATASPLSGTSAANASGVSELDAGAANNSPLWALRKKRPTPPAAAAENTTMVFNFSNRKEVPDYIENDGVIFRRKRELPKPNESGFVLLGDLSVETSTDSDYDDFSMCPPSPCDVEFENANIVIDGKSSIRQKPKDATFRVQFNDTLTSTFEYPSEASLIIEDSFSEHYSNSDDLLSAYENLRLEDIADSPALHHHHVAVDEIIQLPTPPIASSPATSSTTNTPTKNILGNLPLGSAPLSFYTPVKAPIDNLFQLGVTRAPNGNGHAYNSPTANGNTGSHNGTGGSVSSIGSSGGCGFGGGSIVGIGDGLNSLNDEPESLQYIKPANDDLTIAYSEGTQKTDLLY